ncbi:hypothetical protein Nmel_000124, partial [Mimus melanotis]
AAGKLEHVEQSQQREMQAKIISQLREWLQHFKLLPKASSEIRHCSTLGTSADFCYKMHVSLQQSITLSIVTAAVTVTATATAPSEPAAAVPAAPLRTLRPKDSGSRLVPGKELRSSRRHP